MKIIKLITNRLLVIVFLRYHPKYDFRYFPSNCHSNNIYFRNKNLWWGFLWINPIYDFFQFSRKKRISKWPFQTKCENHILGEFVKIREFILVIIFVIFTENDDFGLKMKILKFSGIRNKVNFNPRGLKLIFNPSRLLSSHCRTLRPAIKFVSISNIWLPEYKYCKNFTGGPTDTWPINFPGQQGTTLRNNRSIYTLRGHHESTYHMSHMSIITVNFQILYGPLFYMTHRLWSLKIESCVEFHQYMTLHFENVSEIFAQGS